MAEERGQRPITSREWAGRGVGGRGHFSFASRPQPRVQRGNVEANRCCSYSMCSKRPSDLCHLSHAAPLAEQAIAWLTSDDSPSFHPCIPECAVRCAHAADPSRSVRLRHVSIDVVVAAVGRQRDLHPVQLFRQDDLTTEPAGGSQARGEVEHVLLLLDGFREPVKVLG